MEKPITISTIGGGAGTFNVLSGLKRNENFLISAIVNMADSGGTTGQLRDRLGVLPPGDVRRCIVALSQDTKLVRKLFEYQFDEEGAIGGNKIGNLLLTALADITQNFEEAIDILCQMCRVRGRVIPVTLGDIQLGVKLENGESIIGERYIDISDTNPEITRNPDLAIAEAFLVGDATLNPRAREAILYSDYIIIGPGDLYTSIISNLLSAGMKEALAQSQAKVIFVCNAMTKWGETTHFEVEDFIEGIEKVIGDRIDFVVVNNTPVQEEVAKRYFEEEHKRPLKVRDARVFAGKRYRLIERDLLNNDDLVRHHPEKLLKLIEEIIGGWIH